MQRQCSSGCVARRSRPWLALAALTFAALAPREAAAVPAKATTTSVKAATGSDKAVTTRATAGTSSSGRGEPKPPPAPPTDYATGLTAAYVIAPLLAIPAGAAAYELTHDDTITAIAMGLAVVSVPVTTHAVNGTSGRAALTGVLLPVVTLGSMVALGYLGMLLGRSGCDGDTECEGLGSGYGWLGGAVVGGLGGYIGYAIYDVSQNSSLDEPQLAQRDLRLWALPVLDRERATPGETMRIAGVLAGATLTF
ncbi:MAG TPA: hypothetical protein VNN80_15420 [Polyangiaceae bacterium]|jgi:hypothetical protein|nr:hypothetical protein [Polyangiaceae bacterium]